MRSTGFWSIFCGILYTLLLGSCSAIDGDSAEESRCFNVIRTVDPDATWFNSVKKWYYPLASRLDLYRSVHDLLETEYKNIPEYSVYYDSCLEWTIDAEGYTLTGFNGRTRRLLATAVGQGTADFHSEWPQGMSGRAYTTLTDNKTFAFTAACFSDNQMSWNVFATTKTLDEATTKLIFDHAKSLGYNPDYFTRMRYDSCHSVGSSSSTVSVAGRFSKAVNSVVKRKMVDDNNIPSVFCDACKRMCPDLKAKSVNSLKYYEYKGN